MEYSRSALPVHDGIACLAGVHDFSRVVVPTRAVGCDADLA